MAELILDVGDPINGLALELFVKKSQNWSYENEWRLVFYDVYEYDWFQFVWKNDKKYVEFLKNQKLSIGVLK